MEGRDLGDEPVPVRRAGRGNGSAERLTPRLGPTLHQDVLGPEKWTYFHLYVIIDIYSRYVPGWLLATRETAELAEHLIAETVRKHNVVADQLTIHADRGTSMASKAWRCCWLTWVSPRAIPAHTAPTIIRTQKPSSRPSNTDQSSRTVSAPSKMAARSADGSSGGTTTTTAILGVGFHTPAAVHFGQADLIQLERVRVLEAASRRSSTALRAPATRPATVARPSLDQQAHGGHPRTLIPQPTGLTRVDRFRDGVLQ